MEAVERFVDFYKKLDTQSLKELADLYSEDIVFVDPVKEHRGLVNVRHYFAQLLENVSECSFDIQQVDEFDSRAVITWVMHFRHPKLKAGKNISVQGISQLEMTANKISYQRDYYDLGSMCYEHIPVLGSVIRYLKGRLAS
ncbi:nuclear transport factor 2 family protein [uncultured Paraglaciecola sp.]|uniref:nuclear transport factor 2 family protein n=1 Tax=uncultured Paraglaciecola sp. TaxID=1765024 RepID=UPI0030D7313B|tara:strand:+ start:5383 stop:5805 length:423 start_codon:yes stop_codon:yes gene_type:complete